MPIETVDKVMLYMQRPANAPSRPLVEYIQGIVDQLICDFLGWQVGGGDTLQEFTEWYPPDFMRGVRDDLADLAPYDMVGDRAVQYGLGGMNSQVIELQQLPVRKIVTLWQNPSAWTVPNPPSFPDSTILIEGNDFFVDYSAPVAGGTKISWSGVVKALSGSWYIGPWTGRSVQVKYQAGFTADELRSGPWPAFYPRVRLASVISIAKFVKEAEAQATDPVTGSPGGAMTNFSLADFSVGFDAASQSSNLGWMTVLPVAAMKLLEPYMGMRPYG